MTVSTLFIVILILVILIILVYQLIVALNSSVAQTKRIADELNEFDQTLRLLSARIGEMSQGYSDDSETDDFMDYEDDPLYDQAVSIIKQSDKATASLLQRRLGIGFARAYALIQLMEHKGLIGNAGGNKPGELLATDSDKDPMFDKAVKIIQEEGLGSSAILQRKLQIGYARAARLVDQLESAGYVGPQNGARPREVLKKYLL